MKKRRITMVAGLHLTALDRKLIHAALDAGQEEAYTCRGSKVSKSLTITPTDKQTEMEQYRLCTWMWRRATDVEKHAVKGQLYHASITDPEGRTFQYTLDIVEL